VGRICTAASATAKSTGTAARNAEAGRRKAADTASASTPSPLITTVDGSPLRSWSPMAPPASSAGRHHARRPSAHSASSAQASAQGNQAMLQNSV
jgi:hypothetical protein